MYTVSISILHIQTSLTVYTGQGLCRLLRESFYILFQHGDYRISFDRPSLDLRTVNVNNLKVYTYGGTNYRL